MSGPAKGRIVVGYNTTHYVWMFRSNLIRSFLETGYEVAVLSPSDGYVSRVEELGARHTPISMDNKGTNPISDAGLFIRYVKAMRALRPDVYLGWTIKPNIYGSMAANLLGVPVINNVTGLGTAFLGHGVLATTVKQLYRTALAQSHRVFFQNPDDLALFVGASLVSKAQSVRLPGSGVDLVRFGSAALPSSRQAEGPTFLLLARLLWDKGIAEYVEAARLVRAEVPGARFRILGFLDVENRSAIPRETVEAWVREGVIDYLGHADDVRPHIAAADCVVLPSYREGTPRSLLEAAAMARPLITTDVPGCREVVEDGVNGWLCRPRDAGDLADRMFRFAQAPEAVWLEMGRQSRLKAEREFAESIVIEAYLSAIASALDAGRNRRAR